MQRLPGREEHHVFANHLSKQTIWAVLHFRRTIHGSSQAGHCGLDDSAF